MFFPNGMTNVLHFPRDILNITYASMISFRGVFFKLNKIGTNFKVVYNNLSVISVVVNKTFLGHPQQSLVFSPNSTVPKIPHKHHSSSPKVHTNRISQKHVKSIRLILTCWI